MSALDNLMAIRGLPKPPQDEVKIIGSDPILKTNFRLGESAAAALASVGVAVNDLWELKTGRRQSVAIDVRAAAAALKSKDFYQAKTADGTFKKITDAGHEANRGLTGIYQTKDRKASCRERV